MENGYQSKQIRTQWVDVAKFLAIIAVLIEHSGGILYTNSNVAYFSDYSVGLFVIVMGITTMWSYRKNADAIFKKVWKKCLGIIRPYVVATIIYAVFVYKSFDFEIVWNHLIRFNMSGPFYYVLLYVQLVLISPILFFIFEKASLKRRGFIVEAVVLMIILSLASWTTIYSNIMGVYGGGGKLFGGTYLILLYIGMWFGKYYKKITNNRIVSGVFAVIACSCALAWWRFITVDRCQIDLKIPYGEGFNPPSISFGLYSILVAATIFFFEKMMSNHPNGIPMQMMKVMAFLGRHTLYIFLYHRLFLDIILPDAFAITGISLDNLWGKRIVYFGFMIGGSMFIEFLLEKIHEIVLIAYKIK